jgi:hypothetical protein
MDSVKMQLELKPDVITVRANIWPGVLTVKTFDGHDCYKQMLIFIKQAYPNDQFIPAIMVLK